MKWHNRLAFRFWLAFNSLVLIGIFTFSGLNLWQESTHLEALLRNEGVTAANTLNSAIGLYMLQEDYSHISPLAYSLLSEPNIAYVIVKDKDGVTVNQKGETTIDKKNIIVEKVPLQYFQENVGEVEIGLKTDTLQQKRESLYVGTAILTMIISFLSLIFSYLISKRLASPINQLIVATKKMTAGERHFDIVEDEIIEIHELALAFDKMAHTINRHEEILVEEINKATKDLSEKVDILEVLANISSSVLEDNVQRKEVMKSILVNIINHCQTNQISLVILNKNNILELFDLDQHGNIHSQVLKNANTSLHQAISTKQTVIHNNLNHISLSYYGEQLLKSGLHSLLILPIVAKNKAIGALSIASKIPDYFTNELVNTLSVFTNQIALALDRMTVYESLQNSAFHDYLTGLPNYRLFKTRLNEALEKIKNQPNPQLAVLFLDLDRFKVVNDTLGHTTGDLLLKEVGSKLLSYLSDEDTVTRFGGDEFSILLPNLSSREEAISKVNKIIKSLEAPIFIKEYEIPISASIGVAFYPNDGMDAENLIKNADRAMYRAKEQGKKSFAVYTQSKDDLSSDQLTLENELRKALERNEYVVYYQPKVSIQSGTIAGLEALVRWISPERGLISPGNFIPSAEETGLIVQIGEFVLREACTQSVTWQSKGLPPIPISVNLSTRQLLQSNLVSTVEKIIIDSGINPELLELEITESMSMDIERSLEILMKLKGLGVRISVDDFGTGYSSLSYLRQLPIDRVKIDQSFIKDMNVNPSNEAIVSTIINMGHNLNLAVTAEGVETKEQVIHLQKHDCDEIQGFYFSKPVPPDVFERTYSAILKEAQKWRVGKNKAG